MLRRMMFLTVTVVLILIFYLIVFAKSAEKVTAVVSYKDGTSEISIFDIDSVRCVNLNDLAVLLKDTNDKFDFKTVDNIFIIEKGNDYSGENTFFTTDDEEPGYTTINNADFQVSGNIIQCNAYEIENSYFINIDDIAKILGCEVYIDSESSKLYIDRKIQTFSDISENLNSIKVLGTLFDSGKMDLLREKIKQTFLNTNGEGSFSEAALKKLNTLSMCHDFQLLQDGIKMQIFTKEASIPYSELLEFISPEIKNYAVISLFNGNPESKSLWSANVGILQEAAKVSAKVGSQKEEKIVIDKTKPIIALTFDDGPKQGTTNKILDVLERFDAKATFFVVGQMVEKAPELVKREGSIGCQVGNHSYSHPILTKLSLAGAKSEIEKTSNLVREATGSPTNVGRPPYGSLNHEIKEASGFEWFNWSIDTLDWKTRNTDSIYNEIMGNVGDGDVILMHDLYDTTVAAVEKIVPELGEKGFQFVTIQELSELKGGPDKISGHIKK